MSGELRDPEYTANADAIGTLRLLEAIRILGLEQKTRFYQASTSSCTAWCRKCRSARRRRSIPRSPYAAAKLYAYWITVNYREAYGMHASTASCSTTKARCAAKPSSPARSPAPPPRSRSAGRTLYLGNLDAKRDWGHAREYVEGMWLMLQQDEPDDYVLATGETTTVRQFVEWAFEDVGIALEWRGEGRRGEGHLQGHRRVPGRGRPALFPADRSRPADRRSPRRTRSSAGSTRPRARTGARNGRGRSGNHEERGDRAGS
jgi:GDPmannose 4,6-dehydratase